MFKQQMGCSLNCVFVATLMLLLLTHNIDLSEAKRVLGGGNRKTSSGGGGYSTRRQPSSSGGSDSGHVTKPTYNSNPGSLSYGPGYQSQPKPGTSGVGGGGSSGAGATGQNNPPIGWNVPKQQGPPPVYSASNPVGGAKPNIHEAPPSYNAGVGGSNVHSPITATRTQGVQSGYPSQHQSSYPQQQLPPGATYHSPGSVPAGATYYPSAGQVPAGASYYPAGHMPAGASYYPSAGHMPAGGGYYPPPGSVPAGGTYLPAGAALPPNAVYYSQPPQTSSGPGFGTGLLAGGLAGAVLGHALTPTQTRVVEQAPAANAGGGDGKVIIINNGPPGSVTSSDGTTVITTGGAAPGTPGAASAPVPGVPVAVPAPGAASADPGTAAITAVPLAPMGTVPVAENAQNGTTDMSPPAAAVGVAPGAEQPPAGGIICVPVRVNETDPNDTSKMIEVEKVACYPAPPPPPPAGIQPVDPNAQPPMPGAVPAAQGTPAVAGGDTSAPLAPMNAVPGQAAQQLQLAPTQATILPEQSPVRGTDSGVGKQLNYQFGLFASSLLSLLLAYALQQ